MPEGFLVTVDIEKAFDSFNHCFLLQILWKFGFVIDFVSLIKTTLNNEESCIINRGKTTKYFKLERGTQQGDSISAYLFILILEIFFIFVKSNPKVKGLKLCLLLFWMGFKWHSVAWNVLILITKLWEYLGFIFHIIKILNKIKTFGNILSR